MPPWQIGREQALYEMKAARGITPGKKGRTKKRLWAPGGSKSHFTTPRRPKTPAYVPRPKTLRPR